MSVRARERRLVFGEVAGQYDAYRPGYPDALFDTVVDFGELRAGDRALEIGAGTGKATAGFVARGLDVHALEPSAPMAQILRARGVPVESTLFEKWKAPAQPFRLVYAAQSWHWVGGDDRYERVAAALEPGGTVAFFWNKSRDHAEALGAEIDAAYAAHAPELVGGRQWHMGWVTDGVNACAALTPPVMRTVTWSRSYSRAEWVQLLGTHSDHRILPDRQRERLLDAIGDAIDRHGGRLDVVYDVECYLTRRV